MTGSGFSSGSDCRQPLSCLLALVIYLWARRLYSPTAALLALFLYCQSRHSCSRLATMDLGLCFFFVTTSIFYLSLRRNSTPHFDLASFRYWCNRPSLFFTLCGVFSVSLWPKVTGLLLVPFSCSLLLQPAEDRLTFKPPVSSSRNSAQAGVHYLLLYGVPFKPFIIPTP